MPRQMLHDIQSLADEPRRGTNICLYYGNDKINGNQHLIYDDTARMGYVQWDARFAMIEAGLIPVGTNVIRVFQGPDALPAHERKPFAICPDFPFSVISEDIARHFGLLPPNPLYVPYQCNASIFDIFGLPQPVFFTFVEALLEIRFCSAVEPKLNLRHPFEFAVIRRRMNLDFDDLAILGRDVANHMLFLYRGRMPTAIKQAHEHGRLYFGKDTGE